jgi:predicted transcriptional regulator
MHPAVLASRVNMNVDGTISPRKHAQDVRAPNRNRIPASSWKLARIAWEADGRLSYAEIARKLKVSRQAVAARALGEGWARQHRKADPLFTHLADAGLGRRLPVYAVLEIAETLRAMEQAISDAAAHLEDASPRPAPEGA